MRRWLIPTVVLLIVLVAGLAFRRLQSGPTLRETTDATPYGKQYAAAHTETATFAAGCFWKLEHAMRQVDGVVATASGYTGGQGADVTHTTLSTGATGHAEAVRVTYACQTKTPTYPTCGPWSVGDPPEGGVTVVGWIER